MGNLILFAVLGTLVFGVSGLLFYGAYTYLNPTRSAGDRLRELKRAPEAETYDIITVETAADGMTGVASRLGALAAPASDEERSKQRLHLLQAGYKNRHALEIYNGIRVTAALCFPMLVAPFAGQLGMVQAALAVLGASAFGYYAPALYVSNVTDKRKKLLLRAFPDALDLLVSCVEAGLGLDAAFRRVSLEMETAAPELAREFQLVTHEISAGVPRVEALRHLERRTGLDEIRSLVNMLAQAERFGSSIARGLRVHSRMTRQKRMSRAEEEAAKVSPKLTVIMILFLLPVLGMVLMGPAAIKVMTILGEPLNHILRVAILLMFVGGCLKDSSAVENAQIPKEEIQEGLPPWMTKGEEVRLAVVRELLKSDNTAESLAIIRDMRTKGFNSPELDLLQGKALRIDGVTSEAERLLLSARKRLEHKDPRANEELCLLYADLEQLEDAIDSCRRATQTPDATAAAYNNLGFLLLAAGRAEEAREACEMAVQLDGAEARFRNNLGMAQAGSGQVDQGYRTLKSTMKNADAAYMVGLSLERFGTREEAEKWYRKALDIDPNHAETQLRLDGLTAVGEPWDSPTPDPNDPGAAGQ